MKIIINSSSMVPIYEQIMDQIKAKITAGDLKENDALPSVRTLAKELKISALTVKKAYDNLEQEGYTVTVHGKGTYVAAANTERMKEEQRREVEENIEYQALCRQFGREDVESVVELITDVLCSTRATVRIGGEDIPTVQVRHRFLMLGRSHLEYVFECLRRNTTEVRNIRAYLLTALYNAPVTMGPYYQAEVQHDFG